MSTEGSRLGRCPECAAEIPARLSLIEYDKDGERAVYAECPDCRVPVRPQSPDR
jgi:hypothetical protein